MEGPSQAHLRNVYPTLTAIIKFNTLHNSYISEVQILKVLEICSKLLSERIFEILFGRNLNFVSEVTFTSQSA